MGSVYEAWDERLRRSVAIKCIHPTKELSPARRERLLREARAAAGLAHPSVAQVHDVLEHDGRDYIVMELVEGSSLAARLAAGPLPLRDALDVARQIAEGLEAAHARGIVHRDLKAENVLVDDRGRVKILDFGLAKSTDPELKEESLTQEGMVMGTSRAMSPEQASGQAVDTRSDLFALGSLLYEMLTGTHPFQSSTPLETMQRVVRHRPPQVRRLRPEIPQPVELLVESLLEKDPKRRPQRTGEVAAALRALTGLERTSTADGADSSPLTAHARRRRRMWRGGATAVLALAFASGAWWWLQRSRPPVVVAVLSVEIVAEEPDDALRLLADAVRMTLLNNVAATEGVLAVDPREVDGARGSPAELLQALAADELLVASATPNGLVTTIELRRLRGPEAAVLKSVALEVPTGGLGLVVDTLSAQFSRVFPEYRPDPDAVLSRAENPEDLRRFLEVVRRLDEQRGGIDRDALLAELESIRASSPRLLEAYTRAAAEYRLSYRTTRDQRYLDSARAVVEAGLRVAPRDSRILQARFQLALATDDVDEQRLTLEELDKVAYADPMVLHCRAYLAEAEGRFDDARRFHEARVRLRPSWRAYVHFAQFEMQRGDMAAAERLLRRALEIDPDNTFALGILSESLAYRHPERSIPLLERLVELTGNPRHLTNLGMANMLLGRYENALEPLRKAHELRPTAMGPTINLADAYVLLGRRTEAQALYHRVLEIVALDQHPRRDDQLVQAYCLAQLGEAREAVKVLSDALDRTQGADALGEVHFQASLVLILVGEKHGALLHAEKALEAGLNPIWFSFPWFDPLRGDPAFAAAVRKAQGAG